MYLREFIGLLDTYQVIPEKEKGILTRNISAVTDPAKRRDLKIKQYQREKELRTKIEVRTMNKSSLRGSQLWLQAIRKRSHQTSTSTGSMSDFELIASLLPISPSEGVTDEDDTELEDILRETALILLVLFFGQAYANLESLDQELELLRNMPPPPPSEDVRAGKRKEQDDMWRLDAPIATGGPDGKGLLLDSSGKVLYVSFVSKLGMLMRLCSRCDHLLYSPPTLPIVHDYRRKYFGPTIAFLQ